MPFRLHNPAVGKTVADCTRGGWMVVFACDHGHSGQFSAEALGQRFPAEARLDDIAARLVCKTCGSREGSLDIRNDAAFIAKRDLARFKSERKYEDR